MALTTDTFAAWIEEAQIPQRRLTPRVLALLEAVFSFRRQQGTDYYSTRLLIHFLLHCDCGLKVAQLARLLGIARPTASAYQGLSSKEAIRQAHHRMDGRPYGKLLPRFAGPIAAFLLANPSASRAALIDFVEDTFAVRVSRIALYKFLKKYGLDSLTAPPRRTSPQGRRRPSRPHPTPPRCRSPPSCCPRRRRPPFLRPDAVRRRLPADGPCPRLAGHRP
jgi:hypothetical protein